VQQVGAALMSEQPENPGECECCGFPTTVLTFWPKLDTTISGGGKIIKTDFWYCELCSSTLAGVASRYPGRAGYENADVMKVICHVGNLILAALRTH